MSLMISIDDRRRHRRIQGHPVRMTLIVGNHLHPRVERDFRPRVAAGQPTHRAAITLVQDGGQQLILRRIVVQQPRLRNIRGPRDVRQGGSHIPAGREQRQRFGKDARLLVLTASLRPTGPPCTRCLRVIAHGTAPLSL